MPAALTLLAKHLVWHPSTQCFTFASRCDVFQEVRATAPLLPGVNARVQLGCGCALLLVPDLKPGVVCYAFWRVHQALQ